MSGRLPLLLLSMLVAVPAPVLGQTNDSKVRVEEAWARRAPMIESGDSKAGSGNGVVYVLLVNSGQGHDALLSAASDAAAAAEIHETYRDMGMMMMRPVKKIDLPSGRKVEMRPGGYHIMLLNLKRDLKPGEVVTLTLQFEKAGKIRVNAVIK